MKQALKKQSPENPYLENRDRDDDRYMNLAIDKHNWQVAWRLTFGALIVRVLPFSRLIFASLKSGVPMS